MSLPPAIVSCVPWEYFWQEMHPKNGVNVKSFKMHTSTVLKKKEKEKNKKQKPKHTHTPPKPHKKALKHSRIVTKAFFYLNRCRRSKF